MNGGESTGFFTAGIEGKFGWSGADLISNKLQHGARRSFFCSQHSTRVSHQTQLDSKTEPVVISSAQFDLQAIGW